MWRFALRTVRARFGSYLATVAVVLAGTALLTAFGRLLETGLGITTPNRTVLTQLPGILGGWTLVIVAFGVISTVALTVQQREREIALLRAIAATGRQVRQTIIAETLLVALPAAVVGVLPGRWLATFVLDRLVELGAVVGPVELSAGWFAAAIGAGTSLLAAGGAAFIASRRAARIAPVRALADAATAAGPITRSRKLVAVLFLLLGLSSSTITLFTDDGPLLSAPAGPACTAVAIGLALLCPLIVAPIGRLGADRLGATGRLALRNLHGRAGQAGTVVGPLTLLVGIANGTLYMQQTEDSVLTQSRDGVRAIIASANYLVVAMIIAFCAIAVLNSLIAATRYRRREFGLLRLTGATRNQVLSMAVVEASTTAGLAVVLGTVAAAFTTVPYCLVKTGSVLPGGSAWVYVAILGGTLLLALAATVPTTARILRTRPVDTLA